MSENNLTLSNLYSLMGYPISHFSFPLPPSHCLHSLMLVQHSTFYLMMED